MTTAYERRLDVERILADGRKSKSGACGCGGPCCQSKAMSWLGEGSGGALVEPPHHQAADLFEPDISSPEERLDCSALARMWQTLNDRVELAETQLENCRRIHDVRSAVLDAGGDAGPGYELDESLERLRGRLDELIELRLRFLRESMFCRCYPDHEACRL